MKCLNCGAENADNSKFCGYCGSPLTDVTENVTEEVSNELEQPPKEEVKADENKVLESTESVSLESSKDIKPTTDSNLNNNTNKKSKMPIFIICGVVLLALVVLVILKFTVFDKSKSSVDVLERATSNLIAKSGGENLSGTIVATMTMGTISTTVNVSAQSKYQMVDDTLRFQLKLDKSDFFDEMNAFMVIAKDKISLYAESNLIDMFIGTTSDSKEWLSYELELEENQIDLSNIESDTSVDLSSLDDEFKYVGQENGLKHYTLTINNDTIQDLDEVDTSSIQLDQFNGDLVIDFYLNENDEFEKITMDLSDAMANTGVTKALITIEFKDFNNTIVTIPNEAFNGSDLMEYIESYMNDDYTTEELSAELIYSNVQFAYSMASMDKEVNEEVSLLDIYNAIYEDDYYECNLDSEYNPTVLTITDEDVSCTVTKVQNGFAVNCGEYMDTKLVENY